MIKLKIMNTNAEQIKPETFALIERQAEQLGLSVDDFLRRLLRKTEGELALAPDAGEAEADAEQSPQSVEPAEIRAFKRQQSINWIKAHRAEYGGMFVALDGDKLLGTGKRYGDALRIARQSGCPNAFIGDVLPLDYTGSMGGWD